MQLSSEVEGSREPGMRSWREKKLERLAKGGLGSRLKVEKGLLEISEHQFRSSGNEVVESPISPGDPRRAALAQSELKVG